MLLKREKSPAVPEVWELQISTLLCGLITTYFAWFYSSYTHLLQAAIGWDAGQGNLWPDLCQSFL